MVRHHPRRPAGFINILVPIDPRLADHPLFNHRVDLLQHRIADVVAQELATLLEAPSEDELSERAHSFYEVVEETASEGAETELVGDNRTADVTGEARVQDEATVAAAREGDQSAISEGGFVAGIRCASSPQPGPSSVNPGEGLRTQDVSGGMFIDPAPRPGPWTIDSDSSDLPSLSLPVIQPRVLSPLPERSRSAPHSVISISSLTSEDNFTSVSHNLPPRAAHNPPFPPSLARVSLSEIGSASLDPSMASDITSDTCDEINLRMRAVLKAAERQRPRRRRYRRYLSTSQRESRARVARWLVSSCDGAVRSVPGGADNPIVLTDSDDDSKQEP